MKSSDCANMMTWHGESALLDDMACWQYN